VRQVDALWFVLLPWHVDDSVGVLVDEGELLRAQHLQMVRTADEMYAGMLTMHKLPS
jgi:hypothetical protein